MARRFHTSRKRAYRAQRDALATHFPAARDFLAGLELLCDGDHGFHMGTARHVQFYYGELFLFHLSICGVDGPDPWLELSPRHHGRLKDGATDAAHMLFRRRIHRVLEQLGVPGRTVMRRDDAYLLNRQTPLTFFRLLQGELLDIVVTGDASPWQQELFAAIPKKKRRRKAKAKDPTEALLAAACEAEKDVAALVRDLEQQLGKSVAVRLGPEGARVEVDGAAEHRAESLAEAVAAAVASALPSDGGQGAA